MQKKISPFSSLKFKDYRLFWWGGILSEVGSQMQMVAINWQLYELTNSPIALGILGLVAFIPIILFSLPAGLFVDKHDRKKILIWSQVFPTFFAFILAGASYFNVISPVLIYSMVGLAFVAKCFQGPARQAIIPQLVPRKNFMNAVSLNTMIRQAALVVGPAVAGFMIQPFGVQTIYFINGISFLIYIVSLLPIKVVMNKRASEIEFSFTAIMDGIRFVYKSPILLSTMLLDFLANFFSSATTLLPIFAKDILHVGPQGLGILYAAPSIGSVLAGLIMASVGHIKHQGRVVIGSVLLFGAATLGFGLSKSFYLSLFFLSLVGVGDMISTVLRNTIRQLLTPDHLRGRMVSVNMIFVQGGPQIGETEAGLLAAFAGAPVSVITGGIATLLITLVIAIVIPKLRKYRGNEVAV